MKAMGISHEVLIAFFFSRSKKALRDLTFRRDCLVVVSYKEISSGQGRCGERRWSGVSFFCRWAETCFAGAVGREMDDFGRCPRRDGCFGAGVRGKGRMGRGLWKGCQSDEKDLQNTGLKSEKWRIESVILQDYDFYHAVFIGFDRKNIWKSSLLFYWQPGKKVLES